MKEEETAVGFGMITQASELIRQGNSDLKILDSFVEGAPYNLYGNAIVKGKKARAEVKEVMDYLESFYTNEACKLYYPEPVLKGTDYTLEKYPTDLDYTDMTGISDPTRKASLLQKWNTMLESK